MALSQAIEGHFYLQDFPDEYGTVSSSDIFRIDFNIVRS